MSSNPKISQNISEIIEMRELGQSLTDVGFVEVDFTIGSVTWMNDFALKELGYTLDQLTKLSMFAFVPEEYHSQLGEHFAILSEGIKPRNIMNPSYTANQKISWWYSTPVKVTKTHAWAKGYSLAITDKSGPEHARMHALTNAINNGWILDRRFVEHKTWSEEQIKRIDDELKEIHQKLQIVVSAAERAANTALASQQKITDLDRSIKDELAKQTTELLRGIVKNQDQDERMKIIDNHVDKALTTAISSIQLHAAKANEAIVAETSASSKKMARKVTLPVGGLVVMLEVIRNIIYYWLKGRGKL